MIKLVEIIYPLSGLSDQEFHDHWRHPHATYCLQMRTLRSYIQGHVIKSAIIPDDGRGCVGVAEPAFDNVAEAEGLVNDPIYINYLKPDEFLFVDRDRLDITICEESVVYGSAVQSDQAAERMWTDRGRSLCIKYIQFFRREEERAWLSADTEGLARKIGALRFVRSKSIAPDSTFIGTCEFFWPTLTAFERGIAGNRSAFDQLRAQQDEPFAVLVQAERVI